MRRRSFHHVIHCSVKWKCTLKCLVEQWHPSTKIAKDIYTFATILIYGRSSYTTMNAASGKKAKKDVGKEAKETDHHKFTSEIACVCRTVVKSRTSS